MALWVFAYHSAVACGFSSPLIPPGAIAVDVFMFLSGLLMTGNFLAREQVEPLETPGTIIKFYLRRISRIAPVYYPLLFVALVASAQYAQLSRDAAAVFPLPYADLIANDPSQRELTLFNVLSHASFVFGMLPQYAANNALPDWSLSLEVQFYVVLPFILLAAKRLGFVLVMVILALTQLTALHYVGVYLTPKALGLWPQPAMLVFKINCFMVGVLMAAYFRRPSVTKLATMFMTMCVGQHAIFTVSVLFCFLAVRGGGPTIVAQAVMRAKAALSARASQFLGDISYPVYLIHPLLIAPTLSALLRTGVYQSLAAPARFSLLFGVAAAIVVPISVAMHRWVELPGIRFGKDLANRIGGNPVSARQIVS